MNRRAKKARARRRSQQWRDEKILFALAYGPYPHMTLHGKPYVLRHGTTWVPDEPTKWFGQEKKQCGCGGKH